MSRERLADRRQNMNLPLHWRGRRYEITCGFYDDGRVAEAFVHNTKAGTDVQAVARDSAIILSLALQHGCPLDTIQAALTRDEQNNPISLIAAVVDAIQALFEAGD